MSNRFTVLTFNIMKFGGPVKARKVIERVLALEPRPDLIGFQEVFNTPFLGIFRNARRILAKALAAEGYEVFFTRTGGLPVPIFRDGLLVAAASDRWKIVETDAVPLRRKGVDRRFLQRVCLRPVGGERSISLFNTHLSAGDGDKGLEKRLEQGGKALQAIDDWAARHGSVASILVGDFNAVRPELDRILQDRIGPRFQDTWANAHRDGEATFTVTFDRENTIIARLPPRRQPEASERIDHVFLSSGAPSGAERPVVSRRSEIVLTAKEDTRRGPENLSDHYGVLTEFELRAA